MNPCGQSGDVVLFPRQLQVFPRSTLLEMWVYVWYLVYDTWNAREVKINLEMRSDVGLNWQEYLTTFGGEMYVVGRHYHDNKFYLCNPQTSQLQEDPDSVYY